MFPLALLAVMPGIAAFPSYTTEYYNQTLDHHNPEAHPRWKQRYLINTDHWDGRANLPNACPGPILLYTGNEGPITAFWPGNGFMIETLAPKFGGLLFFPEQRYYGESLPFGEHSIEPTNLRYLTTRQVIEDTVELVKHIKSTLPGATDCPVVAFGGSYGGTLTAYLRASHPEVVIGGHAASAELGYYDPQHWQMNDIDEFTFTDIVTRNYADVHPDCPKAIGAAVDAIDKASVADASAAFHVCEPQGLGPHHQAELFQYALEGMPQSNYPYPIGMNPAYPVTAACGVLVAAYAQGKGTPSALVDAAANVSLPFLGYDGSGCFETMLEGPGGIPGDGPGMDAWGYQSCTETLHPFSARGLRTKPFNMSRDATEVCQTLFNVQPDLSALYKEFGGFDLVNSSSNMIWSSGYFDPWGGAGLRGPTSAKGSKVFFQMAGCAHHLDLRGPNAADPPSVTDMRLQATSLITAWIQEHSDALSA